MTTARSPASSSCGSPIRSSGVTPSRRDSGPLTSSVSREPSLIRTSRAPETFAMSGSSTPVSCTFVPVPLPVAVSREELGADPIESSAIPGAAAWGTA
jgi:hypothetical protein